MERPNPNPPLEVRTAHLPDESLNTFNAYFVTIQILRKLLQAPEDDPTGSLIHHPSFQNYSAAIDRLLDNPSDLFTAPSEASQLEYLFTCHEKRELVRLAALLSAELAKETSQIDFDDSRLTDFIRDYAETLVDFGYQSLHPNSHLDAYFPYQLIKCREAVDYWIRYPI